MGLTITVDEYREAHLPPPAFSPGYTHGEVVRLLESRQVPVPRSTQFRLLDDEISGRQRQDAKHRRWSAEQFLAFEAGCRLLAAGFARGDIAKAVAGELPWEVLDNERKERLRYLGRAEDDLELLRLSCGQWAA